MGRGFLALQLARSWPWLCRCPGGRSGALLWSSRPPSPGTARMSAVYAHRRPRPRATRSRRLRLWRAALVKGGGRAAGAARQVDVCVGRAGRDFALAHDQTHGVDLQAGRRKEGGGEAKVIHTAWQTQPAHPHDAQGTPVGRKHPRPPGCNLAARPRPHPATERPPRPAVRGTSSGRASEGARRTAVSHRARGRPPLPLARPTRALMLAKSSFSLVLFSVSQKRSTRVPGWGEGSWPSTSRSRGLSSSPVDGV